MADEKDNDVRVLLNQGDGAFASPISFDVGKASDYLQLLISPNGSSGRWPRGHEAASSEDGVVLLFSPGGSLDERLTVPLGVEPIGQVVADFNSDGFEDIAMMASSSSQIVVRLGVASDQILAPQDSAPLPQSVPIVVDWNDDGVSDVFDLDQQGRLLLRLKA